MKKFQLWPTGTSSREKSAGGAGGIKSALKNGTVYTRAVKSGGGKRRGGASSDLSADTGNAYGKTETAGALAWGGATCSSSRWRLRRCTSTGTWLPSDRGWISRVWMGGRGEGWRLNPAGGCGWSVGVDCGIRCFVLHGFVGFGGSQAWPLIFLCPCALK